MSDEEHLRAALRARDLSTLHRETVDDLDPGSLGTKLATVTGEEPDAWFDRMMEEPDSGAPIERGLFWQMPTEILERLAGFEELGRQARAAGHSLYYCLVDPGLFDLVLDLYAAGHPTEAGCQGRLHEGEFPAKRHNPEAYLSFTKAMPDHVLRALEGEGLHVYGDGTAVNAIRIHTDGVVAPPGSVRGYRKVTETHLAEDFREDARRAVIAANALFVERMRRAFRLRARGA